MNTTAQIAANTMSEKIESVREMLKERTTRIESLPYIVGLDKPFKKRVSKFLDGEAVCFTVPEMKSINASGLDFDFVFCAYNYMVIQLVKH